LGFGIAGENCKKEYGKKEFGNGMLHSKNLFRFSNLIGRKQK
jgi:hypothetical protein